MNPKISVIMSVYNSLLFLSESIETILSQSLSDFEFIIVNDGSDGASIKILQTYAKKDKRIILINNKENHGLTKSLNKAIATSKGKYIARQDSHNISFSNRLKVQYQFMEEHPEIVLCGCGYKNTQNNITFAEYRPPSSHRKIRKKMLNKNALAHFTIMFRNKQNIVYRDKFKYAQDYDLYLNLLSAGKKISAVPAILVEYRMFENTISYAKAAEQGLFAEKAREMYFERIAYGLDSYEKFVPKVLAQSNQQNRLNTIAGYELTAAFKINNFLKVRKIFTERCASLLFVRKYLPYFLVSFLPEKCVNSLRRLIW